MNNTSRTSTTIEHFVREHLGSSCPDEVFEHIRIYQSFPVFELPGTVYEIGGRLLVTIIKPPDWHGVENNLEQLIAAGKQLRDQQGYNRFRLVIATDDTNAIESLQAAFSSLSNRDEKTHLHVIKPAAIPTGVPVETGS
jgi:hypothetical protein